MNSNLSGQLQYDQLAVEGEGEGNGEEGGGEEWGEGASGQDWGIREEGGPKSTHSAKMP